MKRGKRTKNIRIKKSKAELTVESVQGSHEEEKDILSPVWNSTVSPVLPADSDSTLAALCATDTELTVDSVEGSQEEEKEIVSPVWNSTVSPVLPAVNDSTISAFCATDSEQMGTSEDCFELVRDEDSCLMKTALTDSLFNTSHDACEEMLHASKMSSLESWNTAMSTKPNHPSVCSTDITDLRESDDTCEPIDDCAPKCEAMSPAWNSTVSPICPLNNFNADDISICRTLSSGEKSGSSQESVNLFSFDVSSPGWKSSQFAFPINDSTAVELFDSENTENPLKVSNEVLQLPSPPNHDIQVTENDLQLFSKVDAKLPQHEEFGLSDQEQYHPRSNRRKRMQKKIKRIRSDTDTIDQMAMLSERVNDVEEKMAEMSVMMLKQQATMLELMQLLTQHRISPAEKFAKKILPQ